jgi:hypothetical protein
VLERPGLPRQEQLAKLCRFHERQGLVSTPADIQLGNVPGHLCGTDPGLNQAEVSEVLDIMLAGYLEGHLVNKSGRFWASVGCGIIEFHIAEKRMAAGLRQIMRDFALKPI